MFQNKWHKDLSSLMKRIEDCGAFWVIDSQLKYLNFRVDTRDGGFIVEDRDGNMIDPQRIDDAITKWHEKYGAFNTLKVLAEEQQDMPPEFEKIYHENFWDLLA